MTKTFLDTNILIYSQDKRYSDKQKLAVNIIREFMISRNGVISTQVLQEYAHTALKKLNQREDVVVRNLTLLEHLEVVRQSPAMIRRAVELSRFYRISFWDANIISNAESAGCTIIYSEDLNSGQFYSGIQVVNPFFL